MKWVLMIAKCVWDEITKLGQYRIYQYWDEYKLKEKNSERDGFNFEEKDKLISEKR